MTAKAKIFNGLAMGVILTSLAACASGQNLNNGEIYDPFERTNRAVHEFNIALDKLVVGPAADVYGAVVPEDIRTMAENVARNVGQPNALLNHLLQGDGKGASTTLSRFLINTTLGMGGLADPAAEMGIFDAPTDFGETLATWGVSEGAYIELPVLGPSTVRDTVGLVVDLAIDPLSRLATSDQANYLLALKVVSLLGKRHTYDDLISVLFYESADSYAAQRLSYMQNKRHAVAGETVLDDLEDPYAN